MIAKVTELDRDTISTTLDAWMTIGLIGLYDASRCGRPQLFNEEEQQLIIAQLKEQPRQLKKVTANINEQTGKKASVRTVKRVVKKKG